MERRPPETLAVSTCGSFEALALVRSLVLSFVGWSVAPEHRRGRINARNTLGLRRFERPTDGLTTSMLGFGTDVGKNEDAASNSLINSEEEIARTYHHYYEYFFFHHHYYYIRLQSDLRGGCVVKVG